MAHKTGYKEEVGMNAMNEEEVGRNGTRARRWIEGLGWFDDPAQISARKHWFGQGRR